MPCAFWGEAFLDERNCLVKVASKIVGERHEHPKFSILIVIEFTLHYKSLKDVRQFAAESVGIELHGIICLNLQL